MISIIITSFNEAQTISRAIEAFLSQDIPEKYELLVVAPDKETECIAKNYSKKYPQVKYLKDPGKGKPAALNLVFKKAKGEILILSDGDVFVSKNSVSKLISHFKNKEVGAVSGRVVSLNKKNLFGFWAYLLTESFHNLRLKQSPKNKVVCSGYLYGIRRGIINSIPENILADDAFISLSISKKFKVEYEPAAMVFVLYPTNLPDWIRQKKRTAARFYQLKQLGLLESKTGEFYSEILNFPKSLLLIRTLREVFFTLALIVMRAYIWFRVFFDFRLWKREFNKTWERVESTKSLES